MATIEEMEKENPTLQKPNQNKQQNKAGKDQTFYFTTLEMQTKEVMVSIQGFLGARL